MSATERRRGPGLDVETMLLFGVLGIVLWAGLSLAAGVRLGYWLDGTHADLPGNPIALAILTARQKVVWTPAAIACTVLIAVLVAAAVIAVLVLSRRGRDDHDVDAAAPHMATGHELDRLRRPHVAAEAKRLAVQGGVIGVPIGRTVTGHHDLWADWESGEVDIWGTRTGKTTSRAIPAVLDAPGAVLATSNRRDLVDATCDPRAAAGAVHVFDPQQIVGGGPPSPGTPSPTCCPGPAGSEVKASSGRPSSPPPTRSPPRTPRRTGSSTRKGIALLGHLLHAAALTGGPIADVYGWVTRATDAEPARILDRHGFSLRRLRARKSSAHRTSSGAASTAPPRARAVPDQHGPPPTGSPTGWAAAFDPHGFAASPDTLTCCPGRAGARWRRSPPH